jgi:hypothetical protein
MPTLKAYIGSPPTPPPSLALPSSPLALPSSLLPRLHPPTLVATVMRTQMPTTTLSGAAGVTGTRMPRIRRRGHLRWVIGAIAGALITSAGALAIEIVRSDHGDPTGEPAVADGTSATAASPASGGARAAGAPSLSGPATGSPGVGGAAGASAGGGEATSVVADGAAGGGIPTGVPRAVEKIRLVVDSVPPGATVSLAGKPIGTTPFGESVAPVPGERVYTVDKAGYEPATVTLAADRGGSQRVMLKKKKVAHPARGPADGVGDKGVNPFD